MNELKTIEAHVTKPGHRCNNPYSVPASDIKAGQMMGFYNWTLYYHESAKMYRVTDRKSRAYDFANFNCAAAKLHELGRAHASNNVDSHMMA